MSRSHTHGLLIGGGPPGILRNLLSDGLGTSGSAARFLRIKNPKQTFKTVHFVHLCVSVRIVKSFAKYSSYPSLSQTLNQAPTCSMEVDSFILSVQDNERL